jgi:hypothetical protein
VSGNAVTVSNITAVQFFNNMGNSHGTYSDFNSFGNFGFRYMQGSTNGPGTGATQYYGMTIGLGDQYSASQYASQFYWNRTSTGGNPYVSVRFLEGGSWGSWSKIYAGYADSAGSADYASLTNKTGGTGTYSTTGDYRAPVFYDSNNTGYYADPAATSQFSTVLLNAGLGSAADGVGNDPYGFVSVTRSSAGNYSYYGMTRAGQVGMGIGIDTSNYIWFGSTSSGYNATRTSLYFYMDTSGNTWSPSSSRAPIFYDNDNTGRYVDPNGTTNIGALNTNGLTLLGGQLYVSAINANTLNSGYAGGTDIWINYRGQADGFTDYRDFRVGNGRGNQVMWVSGSGSYAEATNSFRAPIFYDSDNTGYYVNPDGNSYLAGRLYVGGATVSTGYNGVFATNQIGAAGGNKLIYLYNDGGSNIKLDAYDYGGGGALNINIGGNGGHTYINTSTRSPIFYDGDDTGYYLNPNTTSRISTISFDRLQSTGYNTPNQLVTASDDNWTFGCYNSGDTYYMQTKFYGTNSDSRGFRVLEVNGNTVVWRVNGAGNSICSGNVTAYSDERLKTNWQPMPENYVSRLARVKVGIYDRIDGSKLTQVGVGAQSLQTLLPQAVDKADDEMGTLSVNYGSAALASAVELAKEIVDLKTRVAELEALINKLILKD